MRSGYIGWGSDASAFVHGAVFDIKLDGAAVERFSGSKKLDYGYSESNN